MGTATRECRWCGTERRHRRVVRSQTVELTCFGCGKIDMEQKAPAPARSSNRPRRWQGGQQTRKAASTVRKNPDRSKKRRKWEVSAEDHKAYGQLRAEMARLDREWMRHIASDS